MFFFSFLIQNIIFFSLFYRFIEVEKDPGLVLIDFFDMVKYLSQNEIGREVIWDYIRLNYDSILIDYGEDYRLGQMLIDITNTFETEFYYYEVIFIRFFLRFLF